MLTLENINQLERVQKCVFAIIFGQNKYHKNLSKNGKISLEDRRPALCSKFAYKVSEDQNFSDWFRLKHNVVNTRNKVKYIEVPARCDRWMNSPIPFMTRLLNNQ